MLEKQVEELGIAELFAEIIGADNVEGRGKADLAKLWRERNPSRGNPVWKNRDASAAAFFMDLARSPKLRHISPIPCLGRNKDGNQP